MTSKAQQFHETRKKLRARRCVQRVVVLRRALERCLYALEMDERTEQFHKARTAAILGALEVLHGEQHNEKGQR